MSADTVIDVARGELGQSENPPGSNRIKYWDEYDKEWQGQPWCVAFLWWVFRHGGESAAFMGGGKTASCSILLRWHQAHGQTAPVSEVQVGDIVLLNFSGTQEPQHCGLVVETPFQNGKQVVYTIEGNTSIGYELSQDNGGRVAYKCRRLSQIVEVCRPAYTQNPPKPDYEGHWAEESIRKAIAKGVLNGYEDGSFQPDRAVTRAELCVILDRLGLLA